MSFEQYLIENDRIPIRELERVRQLQEESGDSLGVLLTRLGLIAESELADCYVRCLKLDRLSPRDFPTARIELDALSPRFLRDRAVVPVPASETQLGLLMSDPTDDFAAEAVEFAAGQRLTRLVATRQEVESLVERLYFSSDEQQKATDAEKTAVIEDGDVDRLRDLASEAPVIRLVQRLITAAIEQKASDIHIEPMDGRLSVRYRIDGILHEVERLPDHLRAAVVSRIKIMAQLNIAERRLPQDGRVRLTLMGRETDFRVATSPTLHGESVVLRILDRRDVALDFTALGFDDSALHKLRHALAQPHGVILVTGPTGSGKTTTLYTALKELNSSERKILTAEDPIEYTLDGVNQVQVKPQIGFDFAQALRSFLRQDPDVILVGEVRDAETARIAIQAALTGHLLLSTLHTNSAAGAAPRLLDMGIEEFLLSSTLTVVVGQRLVRRLCPACSVAFVAPDSLLAQVGIDTADRSPVTLHRAGGCKACGGSGYAGRLVISEVMDVDQGIQELILKRADAGTIERHAVASGMLTMRQDGIRKALAGLTSIEEVLRVTQNL